MFRFQHRTLIQISGAIWMLMGGYLLFMGLRAFQGSLASYIHQHESLPLLHSLAEYAGGPDNALVILIAGALLIGHFKGRTVLKKSALRVVTRVQNLPNPAPLHHLYSPPFYALIGFMMLLGMSLKFFGVPLDIKGVIDTAIGAALIQGGKGYFNLLPKKKPPSEREA